jgi:predicted glutamine amidotransferase
MGAGAGAATFLLSCGSRLYAHRSGRSLWTRVADGVAMTASEPLTGDVWLEVPERALVVLDAAPAVAISQALLIA